MNDRAILPTYFLFRLSKMTDPKHISQFNIGKNCNSNGVNDLLKKIKTVTLYDKLLTFRETDKKFE